MTIMHVNLTINTETREFDHKPIDCTSLDKVVESALLLHPDLTSMVLSVSIPGPQSRAWSQAGREKTMAERAAENDHAKFRGFTSI